MVSPPVSEERLVTIDGPQALTIAFAVEPDSWLR
ncbi:hypothetical protein HALLA_12805 [Halostagnicola larsenii XH-48]|uniref:Uncharacterized protein n=1 Tax=Halostagnicola larsenii XH-48 TaxID=797299 RepID=W0JVC6_9EURY|nr:hypothetical protein HALLA_12805 [Halostagnicola larsenii XH-48]